MLIQLALDPKELIQFYDMTLGLWSAELLKRG